MKKILFIHHSAGWGGAPINMINIINSLDKTTFQVEVLLLKDSIVSEKLRENNIKYVVASSVFFKKYYRYYPHSVAGSIKWYQVKDQFVCWLSWMLSHFIFAKNELEKFNFDIVHLNSSVLSDWLKPCRQMGKVIIHIQEPLTKGYFGFRHHFFTNQMNKYADHIISISKDNARRINIPSKTTVIYNFSHVIDSIELNIEKYKSKSVLYVGGTSEIKGFYTMVDALGFLNKDIKVYFVGSYSILLNSSKTNFKIRIKKILMSMIYRKRFLALSKIYSNPNAILVGMISDINEYLDLSVCLISPFAVPHFSRPIIEAFARRKPAIGTNIEGMDEIIENGKNGIIVTKDDAKALAEAIKHLCEGPAIAQNMGNYGYELAKIRYSQNNVLSIQSIYNDLLK